MLFAVTLYAYVDAENESQAEQTLDEFLTTGIGDVNIVNFDADSINPVNE